MPAVPAVPTEPVDVGAMQDKIMETLRGCFDPEIPVNIVELGLIYEVKVQETGAVAIRMTLTSPACPAAGSLPPEVEAKVKAAAGRDQRQSGCRLGADLDAGSHVRGG